MSKKVNVPTIATIPNYDPMKIRTVVRPQVQVVQYEGEESYTFQAIFAESTKTRIGKFSLEDAQAKAKAFEDWFNTCAEEIEHGQERPYQIMRTVADAFHSEYKPQTRHDVAF